ncbi:MAG: ABC transporter ATP-binding protein [Candidatus Marsarchaeota archaeon]|nr:ABC transporter ATP-binding protein [Candidatus Marsarchaeota archaeon]MCL5111984.1 ABC transporter ATP-binding protein [Candidatus Marsarchaeota archaeon]
MIEVKALSKRYHDGTVALNNVSFRLDKKISAIIGRNGAGKTTLMRILSTQIMPTSGTARINGIDVIGEPNRIRKMAVSIPQEAKPIDYMPAMDCVKLYLAARGFGRKEATARAEKALRTVGLGNDMRKLAYELSGGMKRKVFVAMAIASDADIIFLDEPTTGLDPFSRVEVWSAIRAIKGQVILTTHYMEEAQALSDDVLMMEAGKIFAHNTVDRLLRPFDGLVRVESQRRNRRAYRVGSTWISYVKKGRAKSMVGKGDVIKPVTLDDLFIKRGVNLES